MGRQARHGLAGARSAAPPRVTGGDGACAGGCSPLLEFDALPELLDDELPLDDRTVEDPVEAL